MSGARVTSAARLWLGTPYVHQASTRGAGCDCLGLIRGIWRDICGAEPQVVPAYSRDWSEPQGEERLWLAACEHLAAKERQDAQAGDILLFRMRDQGVAKHLGVQSCVGMHPRFIHAYSGHGVVESSLSLPWRRRLVARFGFPKEFD